MGQCSRFNRGSGYIVNKYINIGPFLMGEEKKMSNGEALNGRDNAQYVRQQQGHSLILHLLLICVVIGMFTVPYYTISKNHYWHA